MKTRSSYIILVLALTAAAALAQTPAPTPTPKPDEGYNTSGYNIRGDIELGGHIVGKSGNEGTYGTLVDLESGPRLLEQSLEMHALPGAGAFMDDLSMYSFGYGGDPNALTRLRISKDKWYDFNLQFRRDRNFWDYNLLANPFNPTPPAVATFPQNTLVADSPHFMSTIRRMTDLNLTLAPKSPISVRLGFSQNQMYGATGSSYHEGADIALFQPWFTRSNRLSAGVDFNMIPRTRISYDQFYDYFRYSNTALDNNLTYQLDDGVYNGLPPVDLGLVLERIGATSSQPCFNPITNPGVTPPAISPACNGYLSYVRSSPQKNFFPTERLSMQSSYWKRVDLNANFSYSASHTSMLLAEAALGRVSRTNETAFNFTGPSANRRITTVGEFGVTVHLTDRIRFIDTFQWWSFRIPQSFLQDELALFGNAMTTNPAVFNPATCPAIPATCLVYAGASPSASGSGPDLATTNYQRYFSQDTKTNLAEIAVDLSKRLGGRVGYRYRPRHFFESELTSFNETYFPGLYQPPFAGPPRAARGNCAAGNGLGPGGADVVPDPVTGICVVSGDDGGDEASADTTEHALVFGVWARPIDQVRLTFDMDLASQSEGFIRLQPRHRQQYKLRGVVKPKRWITLNGTMNLLEANARWADIDYTMHNRNAGFGLSIFKGEWLTLDLGYNYNGYASNDANICFYSYDPATNTPIVPGGMTAVLAPPGGAATGSVCDPSRIIRGGVPAMYQGNFFFDETVHTGNFNLLVKPVKRVTAGFGYTLTSSTGNLPDFNPDAPVFFNSLNYHLPNAMLAVEVVDHVQLKGAWNGYDYNEKFPARTTLPRDFHANVFTVSARYSF